MAVNQNIAIGEKDLTDQQLNQILPGYENIKNQIASMREFAKKKNDNSSVNVFSILGKRGEGKSSVLLSLRKTMNESEEDIVLPIIQPIILPDDMGKRRDMMGWILGSFKEKINELSEHSAQKKDAGQTEQDFNECRRDWKNTKLFSCYTKVLKQYRYTREDYADILKDNFSGLTEYVTKTKEILDPENELKTAFFELINEMVRVKKDKADNVSKEPLIFIFMDDIDLTKNYCQSILNIVIRYLCHPNIVVFLSGDYNIFETEQFMGYLRSDGLMDLIVNPGQNNLLGERLIRGNRILAVDALKKIMPPAYRYHLKTLEPEERLAFYYNDENRKSLKDLLEEKFSLENTKFKVLNAYGLIFDSSPRGIMNVYYILNNLRKMSDIESVNEDESYISEFNIFIQTLIRSSAILSKYEDVLMKCIQINDIFMAFINYERLLKEIDVKTKLIGKNATSDKKDENSTSDKEDKNATSDKEDKNPTSDKEEGVGSVNHEKRVVLILAHFIESIVQVINRGRKVHGQAQIWELVCASEKKGNKKIMIYPKTKKTEIIFDLYEKMLTNDALNIMPTMDNIYQKDYSLKFYFEKLEEIKLLNRQDITDLNLQDSEWVQEKFQIIEYHRDPFCMFMNKAISEYYVMEHCVKDIMSGEFGDEIYNDIYVEEKDVNQRKQNESNKVKEKLNALLDLFADSQGVLDYFSKDKIELPQKYNASKIAEIDKELKKYFSSIKIKEKAPNVNDEDKSSEDKLKEFKEILLKYSILFKVFKELNEMGDYETQYFTYFAKWHKKLSKLEIYKDWSINKKQSPFTLALNGLEDKAHV